MSLATENPDVLKFLPGQEVYPKGVIVFEDSETIHCSPLAERIFKVPEIQKVEIGKKIAFDKVLMLSESGKTKIGKPIIKGASVEAKLVSHGREKKIIVFKFKRRKGYQKKQGHRQGFSTIQVQKIKAK